jgi:hypothetical protein
MERTLFISGGTLQRGGDGVGGRRLDGLERIPVLLRRELRSSFFENI